MIRRSILALPALAAAAPALALTPEELWSAWQDQAAGFEVTLTAEAVPGTDGSLTLRNWARAISDGPMEPMPADSPVQEVTLRPLEGGRVAVDLGLPPAGVLSGRGGGADEPWIEQVGLAITAADGAEGIEYEVVAQALRLASPPVPEGGMAGDFAIELANPALRFDGEPGAGRTLSAALSVGGYKYVTSSGDPASGFGSTQSGRADGALALNASVTLPEGIALEEMEEASAIFRAFDQGLAVRVEMTNGAATQSASYDGFPFSYSYEGTAEPGSGSISLDRSGLSASGEYGGGTVAFSTPALPVGQIDVTHGPVRAEIRVPMGPEAGEFRYLVAMESLAVGEPAWAALDPQGFLPREPARLVLDVGGRLVLDVAAMAAAEEAGMAPPAPVLESLEVRQFDLAFAGVTATASGSLGFDDALGTPVPTAGQATARIEGLDRLLDALVSLGWITDADAGGARLGLATVFRAGAAPDTRETVIEFREGGSVFANGVQLQ